MSHRLRTLLQRHSFHCEAVTEVDAEAVNAAVADVSFARIRGLFSPEEIAAVRQRLRTRFRAAEDRPAEGEAADAVMRNFQKLAIGGAMQSGVYRPRFIRTLYNPIWAPDLYGMRPFFRRLAALRNRLQGKPLAFATDRIENGLWTAARIHHYPVGGGFLVAHRDTVLPRVARERGHYEFHQLVLLLTKKGVDFERGGGYVEVDGNRFEYEDACELGDVLIYDGRTVHGVAEVDPHRVPDLSRLEGRLVAFASLYKDMRPNARDGIPQLAAVQA